MTVKNIIDAISLLFSFEIIEEKENEIIFKIVSDKNATLYISEVEEIIKNLKSINESDVELVTQNYYEVLIRQENRGIIFGGELVKNDLVNKIEYKIDKPTNEYLIFFLYNLSKYDAPRILRSGIASSRLRRIYENNNESQLSLFDLNILDVIKNILPRFETLLIKSDTHRKKTEFEQLVYAFLFNLSYNMDYTLQPLRFMDEFIQPYRLRRLRRTMFSSLEPPKRLYNNELILYYQKGISSDGLDHQFLSFYHVIEHFFEKIYNDDIINGIKTELTKPNFSYKRTKDISSLVSLIQKRLRYKNEEFEINELEALELTLKKFVNDIDALKIELETISTDLIEYFKSNEVPFCKGNKVNFDSNNFDEIYKNLAKRIYYTRNAIVHSKETDKTKYTPFRDDKNLINEIYLMRLLSELIILENSVEL